MDFVITAETTGQDMMDTLSEGENACIKAALGDAVYQIMLGIPLMMASADPSASAPLFGCLEPENIVVLGVSSMAAQRAEWGPETVACTLKSVWSTLTQS